MRGAAAARAAAGITALTLAIGTPLGCGEKDEGTLGWEAPPTVVRHPEIPNDVLATGRVRNDGEGELRLDADRARVIGSDGRAIRATVRLAAGYSHSLYPPRDAPREEPLKERERLGAEATLGAGESAPLTAAWHRPRGGVRAVRIEIGGRSVPLPAPRP
jgi:hypothetical protein